MSYAERSIYAEWHDSDGALVLSAARTNFEMSESVTLHGNTRGNAAARGVLIGVRACSLTWEGFFTRAQVPFALSALPRLRVGARGELIWGVVGNFSGAPKAGYPMIVAERRVSAPQGGGLLLRLTFQSDGAPLFADDALWD
ncbi:MAG: hypothetical protein CUN51_06560 [Candidatus Thermofonsia Clade 1 bacterium]|uniref:Uncharacterized protein n=1 Tax=Candidatus Thermofonsia Clade 1 bacterium TaxID=2364210 RepID=A0A2M8NZX0_9CHLR|nr:MAG: hypothetical protein CUN51_06560 [Candidatus Thermofonsia Clade 1 bacterium]